MSGIDQLLNLNDTSRKDIKILNKNGKKVTDPQKIINLFNEHYVMSISELGKGCKNIFVKACHPARNI